MRDIRFISGDGESLVLETVDGEKLRLTIDNHIREAIRKQPTSTTEHTLSPREIQDAIRTGSTVEQLVSASGDGEDYVARFAKPVLEELEHMVASALAVRVEIEPDRFNEVRHREFGELIGERLRNGGASKIAWSASRETPFTWLIKATFETMGGTGQATWTFDPRHVVLSPENETAIGLSNKGGFGDSPIPKLQVIVPTLPAPEEAAEAPEESKVTELLDAFKERREAAAALAQEEVLEEVEVFEEVEDVEEFAVELVDEVIEPELVEEAEEPRTESPKKGRAPMPSWDEIVFGSKTED
jgi:hypothetical protein